MQPISDHEALRHLFAGLVEQSFCSEVGMCDPALTTYLVDLLVDFVHIDRLNAVRNAQGKRLDQIATMLAIACDDRPVSRNERDRTMYRHIGDYTLFWAGLFPEQIRRATRQRSDVLLDYVSQGKKSYAIVSELAGEDDVPPASLFRNLSDDFEYCLYGLGLVREGWRHGDGDDAGSDLIY